MWRQNELDRALAEQRICAECIFENGLHRGLIQGLEDWVLEDTEIMIEENVLICKKCGAEIAPGKIACLSCLQGASKRATEVIASEARTRAIAALGNGGMVFLFRFPAQKGAPQHVFSHQTAHTALCGIVSPSMATKKDYKAAALSELVTKSPHRICHECMGHLPETFKGKTT